MSKPEIKKIKFWGLKITIHISDESPDKSTPEGAVASCWEKSPGTYLIWFNKISPDAVAHETWHLFMMILTYIGNESHTFDELNSEIYAYSFGELYRSITEVIVNSDKYKETINENT